MHNGIKMVVINVGEDAKELDVNAADYCLEIWRERHSLASGEGVLVIKLCCKPAEGVVDIRLWRQLDWLFRCVHPQIIIPGPPIHTVVVC